MAIGAWQSIVHGVTKSWTSTEVTENTHTHTHTQIKKLKLRKTTCNCYLVKSQAL